MRITDCQRVLLLASHHLLAHESLLQLLFILMPYLGANLQPLLRVHHQLDEVKDEHELVHQATIFGFRQHHQQLGSLANDHLILLKHYQARASIAHNAKYRPRVPTKNNMR